jgi:hypothetical protein
MAKFSITLKDPDYGVNGDEIFRNHPVIEKFVEWGEYVTIEFDTNMRTARVVPVAETGS